MTAENLIFLAHASEDKPRVRALYDQLKSRGFSPWLDVVDLVPGQNWQEEIPKAIREAAVCLLCLSSRLVDKESYVQREFRYALSAFAERPPGSIYLIPVRLDDCEVPDLQLAELELKLSDLHWVDLFDENGFEKLIRALRLAVNPAKEVPEQSIGVHFRINDQGLIDTAPDLSSDIDIDQASMSALQTELIEACDRFIGCFDDGSGQNAFGYLINDTRRYRDIISAPLESVQFTLAYLHGVRLQKARDAVARTDVDRLGPSLEDDQQAALDTVLGFHGPFILSNKAAQDLHAKANAYASTPGEIEQLREAAKELKEAVLQTTGLVTDNAKDALDRAGDDVGQGRFPEREAVVAETTFGNFFSIAGKASVFAAAAAAGGVIENIVVDSLVGKDLVGLGANAINTGANVVNTVGLVAKKFFLEHEFALKGMAAASKDGFAWLPHFVGWLKSQATEEVHDQGYSGFPGLSFSNVSQRAPFRDIDAPWCPEMAMIPNGTFMMGSPEDEEGRKDNEGPQHKVTINQSFGLGRFLVTFDEYDYFCEATGRTKPRDKGWGRGQLPVINVEWLDARAYCDWLSEQSGQSYRLPSEAMWEYACRAGTTTAYSCGDEITGEQANFGKTISKTTEVGSYPANPWGLHDIHGNVWEWVEDHYESSYQGAPNDGGTWAAGSVGYRVLRGGSWADDARSVRSAYRYPLGPGHRGHSPYPLDYFFGFRCARVLA